MDLKTDIRPCMPKHQDIIDFVMKDELIDDAKPYPFAGPKPRFEPLVSFDQAGKGREPDFRDFDSYLDGPGGTSTFLPASRTAPADPSAMLLHSMGRLDKVQALITAEENPGVDGASFAEHLTSVSAECYPGNAAAIRVIDFKYAAQQVRAHSITPDPRVVSPQRYAELVRIYFTHGQCMALAMLLSPLGTGRFIGCDYRANPATGDLVPSHFMVELSGGRALDICGVHNLEDDLHPVSTISLRDAKHLTFDELIDLGCSGNYDAPDVKTATPFAELIITKK